jgi:hypothetical protein
MNGTNSRYGKHVNSSSAQSSGQSKSRLISSIANSQNLDFKILIVSYFLEHSSSPAHAEHLAFDPIPGVGNRALTLIVRINFGQIVMDFIKECF